MEKLENRFQRQKLLIRLYKELLDSKPLDKQEFDKLKIKVNVTKNEIVKNNKEIDMILEDIKKAQLERY